MMGKNHVRVFAAVTVTGVVTACCSGIGFDTYAGLWSNPGSDVPAAAGLILGAAWGVFGSYLPDIDSRKSELGRFVRLPVAHRTWTHCIWAVLLIWRLCMLLPGPGTYGLLAGYLLHLIMDSWSEMGVCWFYPFTKFVYNDNGVWRKGAGGNGPKVAQGHHLRVYRTAKPDPGHKYIVTNKKTGKTQLTDGGARLLIEIACLSVCLWQISRYVMERV